MFLRITFALNLLLIATGVFQYLKLELHWALLGVGAGAFNVLTLWLRRRAGALVVLDAVANVAILVQGVVLGYQSVRAFIEGGAFAADRSIWDIVSSSHDFSYAIVYVGAGLCMLLVLNQHRSRE